MLLEKAKIGCPDLCARDLGHFIIGGYCLLLVVRAGQWRLARAAASSLSEGED